MINHRWMMKRFTCDEEVAESHQRRNTKADAHWCFSRLTTQALNSNTKKGDRKQCGEGISPVSHPRSHSQHWMIYVHLKQKRLPNASLSMLLLLNKGVATQVEKGRTEVLILDAVESLGGVLSVSPPETHHRSFFFFSSFPLFLFSSFSLFSFLP